MRSVGWAKVLSIADCPPIDPVGHGRVVIGRFVTQKATNLLQLTLDDGTRITGTTTHPIWSVDDGDWRRMEDFRVGDRVKTLTGDACIAAITSVPAPADVFNIEVDGDHVYRIAECGVLVHNVDYGNLLSWLPSPSTAIRNLGEEFARRAKDLLLALPEAERGFATFAVSRTSAGQEVVVLFIRKNEISPTRLKAIQDAVEADGAQFFHATDHHAERTLFEKFRGVIEAIGISHWDGPCRRQCRPFFQREQWFNIFWYGWVD